MKHGITTLERLVVIDLIKQLVDDLEEQYPNICSECLHIAISQAVINLGSERYTHKKDSKHVDG